MFKTLTTALTLAALSAGTALADEKPWDLPRPDGMTAAHEQSAIAARKVQEGLPEGQFGYDPRQADWDWSDGRNRTIPMSNMTISGLTSLLTGRYHVMTTGGTGKWSARYYAPDGKTHFCEFNTAMQDHHEWVSDRYVATAAFGMAGMFHWNPEREKVPAPPEDDRVGWPAVYDGDSGLFYTYWWTGTSWMPEPGWIQEEYAAEFAEHCPDLPRDSEINNDQLGETINDLLQTARPVTGIKPAFKNDPRDPMTASMYYWFNAPE